MIIFICEDCGREYKNKPPFPEPCVCGNICEEFYRFKDIYDEEDDQASKPLLGVNYDPEVLKERNDRLSQEITQPIEKEESPGIDYTSMTIEGIKKLLDLRKVKYDKRLSKNNLIKLCEE